MKQRKIVMRTEKHFDRSTPLCRTPISGLFTGLLLIFLFPFSSRAQCDLPASEIFAATANPATFEEHNTRLIPFPLIKMNNKQETYILLVDKSLQELSVYKYDVNYHKVKTYDCTTGSIRGNKQVNGDQKTPEGMYFFTKVWNEAKLIGHYGRSEAAQFGIRALEINYPNEFDRINNKNGYGIWLHATDKPERIKQPFDTKGCIVVRNTDMAEITQFITLEKTPLIIVKELEYYAESNLYEEYQRVIDFLNTWRTSWEQRDFNTYESAYSPRFRCDKKNLTQWLDYKKRILPEYDWVKITFSNMRIFKTDDYYYAEFRQTFQTESFGDVGTKQVYLLMNNGGNLEIITEQWKRAEQVKGS